MKIALLPLLVFALFLLSGCVEEKVIVNEVSTYEKVESQKAEFNAVNECIEACSKATIPLSNGPCLLNPMFNPEWVCDVAHSPRQEIDNQIENQCSAFGKTASHFIEVTPECELIKQV